MGKEHRLAGPAGLVDVELATDDVGAQLRHPAERRGLSAGDRDEALEAVGLLVVERLEGARQLASAVPLASRADERAGSRPGGTLLGMPDGRDELRPLGVHPLDVIRGDAEIVRILDHPRARAHDGERTLRQRRCRRHRTCACG